MCSVSSFKKTGVNREQLLLYSSQTGHTKWKYISTKSEIKYNEFTI